MHPQVNSQPVSSLDMMGAAGAGLLVAQPATATAGMPAPVQAALQVR